MKNGAFTVLTLKLFKFLGLWMTLQGYCSSWQFYFKKRKLHACYSTCFLFQVLMPSWIESTSCILAKFASIFITELRQNDNGIQNMSGLNDYLVQLLSGRLGGLFPHLYGNGIFCILATILPHFLNPSPPLHLQNVSLTLLSECIGYLFSDHHNHYKCYIAWIKV